MNLLKVEKWMNDRYFFLNISLINKRSAKQNSSKLCLKNEGIITSLKVNTKSKIKTEVKKTGLKLL